MIKSLFSNVVKVVSPYSIEYQNYGDAGADIRSNERTVIPVGGRKLVSTGVFIELPEPEDNVRGWGRLFEAQIRPRSGLAHKFGVTVLNSPGTIDQGYRGEIKVNLINHGDKPFAIEPGDRIAQLVISTAVRAEFIQVDQVNDNTQRGTGGHGSTGVA